MAEPTTLTGAVSELVHDGDSVPALRPDVAIIHAQEADREGNLQLCGIPGVQKEAILCARRSIVTVERIIDRLEPRPGPQPRAGARLRVRNSRREAVSVPLLIGDGELAETADAVVVIAPHSKRTFVERLGLRTTVGYGDGAGARAKLGFSGRGPTAVVTDLGVLEPDPESFELT